MIRNLLLILCVLIVGCSVDLYRTVPKLDDPEAKWIRGGRQSDDDYYRVTPEGRKHLIGYIKVIERGTSIAKVVADLGAPEHDDPWAPDHGLFSNIKPVRWLRYYLCIRKKDQAYEGDQRIDLFFDERGGFLSWSAANVAELAS